jgi:hypothetical protein
VEVIIPSWARRIAISPQANGIKVVVVSDSSLTDGDAYVSDVADDAETVAGDAKYFVPLTAGRGNIPQCQVFVYAATNPTVIEFSCEESEVG